MNPIFDHETPLAKSKSHGVFFGVWKFCDHIIMRCMGLKVVLLVVDGCGEF